MTTTTTTMGRLALLPWLLIEHHGIDPAPHFKRWGHDKLTLTEPDCRVPYAAYEQMWALAADLIDDPHAGLNMSSLWHPSAFGVLGYSMLVAVTLRRALNRMIRYQAMVAEESQLELVDTPKGVLMRNNNHYHQSKEWPLLVDASITFWVAIMRFDYGERFNPVEVNLMRPRPASLADEQRYRDHFKCPVHFGCSENSVVLPADALEELLPSRDESMVLMHERLMDEYMRTHGPDEWLNKVRDLIIRHLPDGDADKEHIAALLYMSPSTFLRRLRERGTTFNDLVGEIRQSLARHYLEDTNMPLIEISYLLGFSDTSSFSRAFRRWTGKAPTAVRGQ